jgi:hypothetical protein
MNYDIQHEENLLNHTICLFPLKTKNPIKSTIQLIINSQNNQCEE